MPIVGQVASSSVVGKRAKLSRAILGQAKVRLQTACPAATPLPTPDEILLDDTLDKMAPNNLWLSRRVMLTERELLIARVDDDHLLDKVPLREIEFIRGYDDLFDNDVLRKNLSTILVEGDGSQQNMEKKKVLMQGSVRKRGKFNKSYKERFFVLLDGKIMYYHDESSFHQGFRPEGSISVLKAEIEKQPQTEDGFIFTVHDTLSNRNFTCACDLFSEREAWCKAIDAAAHDAALHQDLFHKFEPLEEPEHDEPSTPAEVLCRFPNAFPNMTSGSSNDVLRTDSDTMKFEHPGGGAPSKREHPDPHAANTVVKAKDAGADGRADASAGGAVVGASARRSRGMSQKMLQHSCVSIHTIAKGFNSGKTFLLRAHTEEQKQALIESLLATLYICREREREREREVDRERGREG